MTSIGPTTKGRIGIETGGIALSQGALEVRDAKGACFKLIVGNLTRRIPNSVLAFCACALLNERGRQINRQFLPRRLLNQTTTTLHVAWIPSDRQAKTDGDRLRLGRDSILDSRVGPIVRPNRKAQ